MERDKRRMPGPRLTTITVAALAAGALAFAACGDDNSDTSTADSSSSAPTRTVDDSSVESGIEQQLSTSSTKVTSAKCPGDEKVEKGATFTCSVTWSNGASGKAKVTQEGGNRYTYEPVSGSVQIPGATVEKELQAQLAKEGAPNATVNCPDTIIVKVDSPVTCDVSGAGGNVGGTVTYTFSNAEGDIDTSSVSTS